MKRKNMKVQILLLVPIVLVFLPAIENAPAHKRAVHQKSTETAYSIMRAAESGDRRQSLFSMPEEGPSAQHLQRLIQCPTGSFTATGWHNN
jgi:hypothetical protein